jgi:hypothetical protein
MLHSDVSASMKALAAGVNAAEIDWPGVGTSLLDYSYPEG